MSNIPEVGVFGTLGTIPGATQSALRFEAAQMGLQGSTANTLGSLKLVGEIKIANTAFGEAISPSLPEYNLDASGLYNQVQDFQNYVTDLFGGSNVTSGSSASGGFVLYPNKPNTNMLQSVYSK